MHIFFFFILILTFLICTRLLRLTSVLLLGYFSSIFLSSCVYRKFFKKLLYFLSKIIFRFKESERISENYNIFLSKC